MDLPILRLPHAKDLPLPAYATAGAAAFDLAAAVAEPLTLAPGARALVPTGLAMAIPEGWEGQIRSRSGLGGRDAIVVTHGVGTIDSDYRGEVFVAMLNLSENTHTIQRGDRIAQFILAPCGRASFVEVNELPSTERGAGGFGSTGKGSNVAA
jgi:dUTP pyrophosphatase